MPKERRFFVMIWNNFIASLKPRAIQRKLIGEDYYGTKYYEEPPRPAHPNRPPRSFVPVNKEDFEQELPAEWEAWLRHRRKNPPTREEIEANYQLAMTKKQNAAKLADTYSNVATETLPTQSTSSQPTNPGNYPTYQEYKDYGKDYKPKDPYKE
ncbi:Mimitin, mitochondrial [Ooceraea biroi]|uniref:Mimitin, mitochondrial n=1 Tax=Ooceraea biroi TaxID=2015173 RepID=A0A026WV85_OOCBI|nr:Mimitin, mitochondrial [Ooceraea biroi]